MSYHTCEYCGRESRFVCVKCKKDICKEHAVYERYQDRAGEWVCTECHSKTISWSVIIGIVAVIVFIVFVVIMITQFNNFSNSPFP